MSQGTKRQLLPSHYRILKQLDAGRETALTPKELKQLERDYRWGAPGVSDDASMIDFFDTPRPTLFEGVIRLWNCAWLVLSYTDLLTKNKTAEIVDVGAGRGETFRCLGAIRIMKGARFNYTALDIDIRKREVFQALYPSHASKYKICDIREGLPFDENSVDAFISSESIEHITKQEGSKLLSDMFKCLKKDGVVVMTTPNAAMRRTATSIYHAHEWRSDELRAECEKIGFKIEEWFYLGVPIKAMSEMVPKDFKRRISPDLLRAVLGPASGKEGAVIFCVIRKE